MEMMDRRQAFLMPGFKDRGWRAGLLDKVNSCISCTLLYLP